MGLSYVSSFPLRIGLIGLNTGMGWDSAGVVG